MAEWRLFPEGTVPECATPEWYAGRDAAHHLEEPGQRERLTATADMVRSAAASTGAREFVDLGCGDGGLLQLVGDAFDAAWGYDLQPANIDHARDVRKVDARLLDMEGPGIDWAPFAACTETLEHLVDPHAYVREIAAHADRLVASSPAFETPGSHYEYHLWAWDAAGYRALMEQAGYTVKAHRLVGMFQITYAAKGTQ